MRTPAAPCMTKLHAFKLRLFFHAVFDDFLYLGVLCNCPRGVEWSAAHCEGHGRGGQRRKAALPQNTKRCCAGGLWQLSQGLCGLGKHPSCITLGEQLRRSTPRCDLADRSESDHL